MVERSTQRRYAADRAKVSRERQEIAVVVEQFEPVILAEQRGATGCVQLIRWRWPELLSFRRTEQDLLLEMSLPPHSTDASAEFPEMAPGESCFLGTLFVRYPGVLIQGRGEGGESRVVRCTFAPEVAARILARAPAPELGFLQALLAIESDTLRTLLRLALREITVADPPSPDAVEALLRVIAIELERLFGTEARARRSGRLAAWQHVRIRERLQRAGRRPTAGELAALCGLSTRHLQRQFLALTGKRLGAYIDSFWVDRAKAALAGTDQSVKVVAAQCGFAHTASFSRAFRQETGESPRAFRQRR